MALIRWTRTLTGFGATLAFLGATGCGASASSEPESGPSGGEAVWTDDSEAIAIDWFQFYAGGTRFEKRRAELTEEELVLLADLKTLPPSGLCWNEVGEAEVTVSSTGSEREYSASDYDGDCGDPGVEPVSYAPVLGLLESAGCLTAKGYDGSSLATAPSVRANDGCYHGIFNAVTETPEWWFVLDVPEPATYHLTLDGCGDRELSLSVLDEAGDGEISNATTAGEPCPSLEHTLTAGTYAIHLDMIAGTFGGDFFLKLDTLEN